MRIRYTRRRYWKYRLHAPVQVNITLPIPQTIKTDYLALTSAGQLTIHAGYMWDGASGPAKDTPNFMRASLVHDALYQLIRLGLLHTSDRRYADQLLRRICLADGIHCFRAWYVYWGVRIFGGYAIQPEVIEVPINVKQNDLIV